jgi:hypothetical protein
MAYVAGTLDQGQMVMDSPCAMTENRHTAMDGEFVLMDDDSWMTDAQQRMTDTRRWTRMMDAQ